MRALQELLPNCDKVAVSILMCTNIDETEKEMFESIVDDLPAILIPALSVESGGSSFSSR